MLENELAHYGRYAPQEQIGYQLAEHINVFIIASDASSTGLPVDDSIQVAVLSP
jgi:hypothetical protein